MCLCVRMCVCLKPEETINPSEACSRQAIFGKQASVGNKFSSLTQKSFRMSSRPLTIGHPKSGKSPTVDVIDKYYQYREKPTLGRQSPGTETSNIIGAVLYERLYLVCIQELISVYSLSAFPFYSTQIFFRLFFFYNYCHKLCSLFILS